MKQIPQAMAAAIALCLATTALYAAAPDNNPPGPQGGRGEDMRSMPVSPLLRALDLNNDGILDADELAKAPESQKKLDTNKDGKLSPDEYLPQLRNQGGPGGSPGGPGAFAGRSPREAGGGGAISLESTTLPKDDTEKKILAVLDDMDKNQRQGHPPNVQREEGRLLRLLAESTGAKHIVEVGTANGYSTIWLCLGLRSTGGKLTTYEIDPQIAAIARANFKRAGVDKIVTIVEGDAHKEAPKLKEPIDLLFLDADKEGYIDYLNKLLPLVRAGGLVVAHDMNQRMADPQYVKAITGNPELETVFLNTRWGIGVTLKKR